MDQLDRNLTTSTTPTNGRSRLTQLPDSTTTTHITTERRRPGMFRLAEPDTTPIAETYFGDECESIG